MKPVGFRHWLAAGTLAGLLAVPCVGLGLRETERHEVQRAVGVHMLSSLRASPIPIDSVRVHVSPYRRIGVTGSYDHAHEILIRGREHRGEPGFHLVTPLRVVDGAFLVLRGWIPRGAGAEPDLAALREPGTLVVEGFPLPKERVSPADSASDDVAEPGWPLHVDALQVEPLRARFPYRIFPFVVHQSRRDDLPSSPLRLAEPATDDPTHRRNATAWYVAAAALAGLPFAGLAVLRRRT